MPERPTDIVKCYVCAKDTAYAVCAVKLNKIKRGNARESPAEAVAGRLSVISVNLSKTLPTQPLSQAAIVEPTTPRLHCDRPSHRTMIGYQRGIIT